MSEWTTLLVILVLTLLLAWTYMAARGVWDEDDGW